MQPGSLRPLREKVSSIKGTPGFGLPGEERVTKKLPGVQYKMGRIR
jgi:hypothetical protein